MSTLAHHLARLRSRVSLETLLFVLGVGLRLRLQDSYDPRWGWDSAPHLQYVEHVYEQRGLPALSAFRTSYNPPLYYVLAALLYGVRRRVEDIQLIGITAGIVTLVVIWIGLRRTFPKEALARSAGLGLAAVLPAAIHSQGMLGNEALLGAFTAGAMLWVRPLLEREGAARWRAAGIFALLLTAALLVKVSALLLLPPIMAGAVLMEWRRDRGRASRLLPVVIAVVTPLLVAVPVHARHYGTSGKIFPTGYDALKVAPSGMDVPYLQRRAPRYYVDPCLPTIVDQPQHPACTEPTPRFWPVLVATTFGDYYNYRYSGAVYDDRPTMLVNGYEIALVSLALMRLSVASGLLIAAASAAAAVAAIVGATRRGDVPTLVVLAMPVLALVGQLHHATYYPSDKWGPVKGTYMLFATAPLFLCFGGFVAWAWKKRERKILAVLALTALALVATYSIEARWHGFV